MKPTIKTTDDILDDDIEKRCSLRTKDISERDIMNWKRQKWLKLDEEIAWLEEQHKLLAELCNVQFPDLPKDKDGFVQFPNGFIEPLRKLIVNNAKRLEQLRGGEE